ncbi:MAG: YtxH domain-containing protein [Caldilineaceae bacterium]|nr:YtxH domain-containing protein [Caldilineaceae bacterium]
MSNYRIQKQTQATGQIIIWSILSLLVGVGIGAMMALLNAPASGKKTRRKLARSVEDGLDSGQEAIEPVVKKLEKEVGELRHTLEERIAKLR